MSRPFRRSLLVVATSVSLIGVSAVGTEASAQIPAPSVSRSQPSGSAICDSTAPIPLGWRAHCDIPSIAAVWFPTPGGGYVAGTAWSVATYDGGNNWVTAAHVVCPLGPGDTVRMVLESGTSVKAQIVATRPMFDVALLWAPTIVQPLPITTTNPPPGAPVVSLYDPLSTNHAGWAKYGTAGYLWGSVPVKSDQCGTQTHEYNQLALHMWTDPGSSGGPVVNQRGAVVGIVETGNGMGTTMAADGGTLRSFMPWATLRRS